MPRRSRNQITLELARAIVDKLQAESITTRSDEHDRFGVFHGDRLVASFGIRRSSQRNKGHDHIPRELGVGPHFAKDLAWCPKSRNDYLRHIGVLPEEEEEANLDEG